jgi:hypothetical protein
VFSSNRDGNNEIYVMGADGASQTRLTNNAASDTWPAWSPDSNLLYYLSKRDGFLCLWAQRLDPATKRPAGAACVARDTPGVFMLEERADLFDRWMGGAGVAAQLLFENCPEGADPLGRC